MQLGDRKHHSIHWAGNMEFNSLGSDVLCSQVLVVCGLAPELSHSSLSPGAHGMTHSAAEKGVSLQKN